VSGQQQERTLAEVAPQLGLVEGAVERTPLVVKCFVDFRFGDIRSMSARHRALR
jgi:hypothetical protein